MVTVAADGTKGSTSVTKRQDELEEVTKKWGLEAGLWKALRGAPSQGSPDAAEGASPGADAASQGSGTPPPPAAANAKTRSNAELAKELLAKYGGAYLATSVSLAIVSFSFFYVLVDRGVDVASLLEQVGITVDGTSETVGTVALAYAAHKAASPIRFPPTVLLTPIVADFFSKKSGAKDDVE